MAGKLPPSEDNFGKPGYGIDQPGAIVQLTIAAAITIVTGFVVSKFVAAGNPDLGALFLFGFPTIGFLIIIVAVSFYWSSRLGKPREVERMLNEIPWGGSETVIDVGCGRGLLMVNAARRLYDGQAVGVDIWRARDLSGNDPRSIWANANEAGVLKKVWAVKGDARDLPFPDGYADVAASSMAIHMIGGWREQTKVLEELIRITKPGGRVAIVDSGRGREFAAYLREHGLVDLSLSRISIRSFPPVQTVIARKPFV